ncbi:MAG TPA: hypothetical protein DDY77_05775 [Clostridiales bacterium]|nr:hypothetical protein [Clostridiales bacterium]
MKYVCKKLGIILLSVIFIVSCVSFAGCNNNNNTNEGDFKVTFNYNYENSEVSVVGVKKGEKVSRPNDSVREGYKIYNWYIDAECTVAYDFDSAVTEDITLYAYWLKDGVEYHDVTIHYGNGKSDSVMKVEDGTRIANPRTEESETAYFAGWYSDSEYKNKFVFSTKISEDMDIYGKWINYSVFEAEDLNLEDFVGRGYSGEVYGNSAIVYPKENTRNASNNAYVSYLYASYQSTVDNTTLEFHITASASISGAVLAFRISAEYADITINGDMYEVLVNGTKINYEDISLLGTTTDLPFKDFVISPSVSLHAGDNTITLRTANTQKQGTGGTMNSTAPLVDCIKIAVDGASVSWTDNSDYYKPKN